MSLNYENMVIEKQRYIDKLEARANKQNNALLNFKANMSDLSTHVDLITVYQEYSVPSLNLPTASNGNHLDPVHYSARSLDDRDKRIKEQQSEIDRLNTECLDYRKKFFCLLDGNF